MNCVRHSLDGVATASPRPALVVVVITFAISLLTSGLGVYLGTRYFFDSRDYVNTALTGLSAGPYWFSRRIVQLSPLCSGSSC